MSRRSAIWLAWSVWTLALVVWAMSLLLWAVNGFPLLPGSDATSGAGGPVARVLYVLTFTTISTVGALITSRHPTHPIGWLSGAAPVLVATPVLAAEFTTYALQTQPGSPFAQDAALWLGWLSSWTGFVGTALIGPILLLFPDGHLPSVRWRPVFWLSVGGAALAAISAAFMPGPLRYAPAETNPLGVGGADGLLTLAGLVGSIALPVGILFSAGSLFKRLREAHGELRQQLKWTTYGAVIWAIAFAVTVPHIWSGLTQLLYLLALSGFMAAVGLAMLKHRLYDIDLVINRTLVYGGLALFTTVVYVGVVSGVGQFVGTRGDPNLALSLLTTAMVAVAFQPLRERVQRLANRLVYGHRASPYEVLADFSQRVAGALSADEVLPRIAEAAAHGVSARRSGVRVYVPGAHDLAVAWPIDSTTEAFDRTLLVLHQGEPVGEIAVSKPPGEPITPAEEKLLADLASQAGAAFKNVRLSLELQARLEELRASRQRIVAAQDVERRRLERDLHDGAQQHLVALAVNARLARELISSDPQGAEELLIDVGTQADEALVSLRDLAHGVFPPALADRGITAALEADLVRSRSTARLEVERAVATVRYAPEVEAAVYFCCLEALQNVAKHAPDAPAGVRLKVEGDWLIFEVEDRGLGFEPTGGQTGTGLQGMADRLAAIGGTLSVRSALGQGTTVTGRVAAQAAPAGM